MRTAWFGSALLLSAIVACHSIDNVTIPDRCFVIPARVVPGGLTLQPGDTVTVHAQFIQGVPAVCLPPDTSAAHLRWYSSNPASITVDSVTGLVTGVSAGWAGIRVQPESLTQVLGVAGADVPEPPTADTIISEFTNHILDSATLVLQDAHGGPLGTFTLHGGQSLCAVTPLSDSVRYSGTLYSGAPAGPTPLGPVWVVHSALVQTHTWQVDIEPQASGPPFLALAGVEPKLGC